MSFILVTQILSQETRPLVLNTESIKMIKEIDGVTRIELRFQTGIGAGEIKVKETVLELATVLNCSLPRNKPKAVSNAESVKICQC